jgi:hypothetical protein
MLTIHMRVRSNASGHSIDKDTAEDTLSTSNPVGNTCPERRFRPKITADLDRRPMLDR